MIVIQLVTLKKVLLYHIILHYPGGIIWWSWPFTGLYSSRSLSMWKERWLRISWSMWPDHALTEIVLRIFGKCLSITWPLLPWWCSVGHVIFTGALSLRYQYSQGPWTTSNIALIWLLICWRRVGSLVLLVHDFADHWLELAKMARYVRYQVWYLLHMRRFFA